MAIVEVSIVPLGTGTTGVSRYVASCVKVLRGEKDLKYQLTPMGTVIEGDLDMILGAIRKMHEQPFISGAKRVLTTVRVDDRRDRAATMDGKVDSVIEKLSGKTEL